MALEIFRLFGTIMVNSDDANNNIKKTSDNAEGFGHKLISGIGTVAKWGATIVSAAGSAAIAIGSVATKAAIDFESQMSNVATLLDGDVNKRITELGEAVKKISKETGTSTELLTDGLYQVISAFGDTADSMGILETASKGAKAGNATVTDSVNLLAAVTKGYGDTSAEAAKKASDLAFLTVKLGQTSFPELASSMGKVIPLASTMKVSQEELFGAMATLTGVTGNTAEVTTQLRATIQGMLQPTTAMASKISELGYENGQAMIESLGLQGTLEKLKESVGNNEIAFSELFSSVEAKNAVLALTGAQAENFTEKTNAMKSAIGATDEAFKKQTDNIKANFSKLKNSFDVMIIDLGEKFLPVLDTTLNWVNNKMPVIQDILGNTFDFIGSTISFLNSIFAEATSNISFSWSDLIILVKELWEQYGKPVFDTFCTVFNTIYQNIEPIINGLENLWFILMSYLSTYWDSIGKPVFDFFINIVKKLVEVFNYVFPILANIFSGLCDTLKLFWENIGKPVFEAIGVFISNVLLPLWEEKFSKMADKVMNIFKNIGELWNNVLKPILDGIILFIGGIFQGNWSKAWDGIKSILKGLWEGLKSILLSPIEWFLGKIEGLVDKITSPFRKAADAISDVWSSIKSAFKLPHFTLDGSLNPLKWIDEGMPSIGVDWYAKGGIFTKPTVLGGIGVGDADNGKGSNPEAVIPLDVLWEKLDAIASRPIILEVDGRESMRAFAPYQDEFKKYNIKHDPKLSY